MAQKKLDHKNRALQIIKILKKTYPDARCSLIFANPFQLLVATILSAQCTDERVNKVTPLLFNKLKTPLDFSNAPIEEIEKLIRSTGFYKNKARSLKLTSQKIVQEHGGEVPGDIEKLTQLRGVGRKTANVVLGNIFRIPGIVVDTHVGRLSRRMGFTQAQDPVKVEFEIMEIVPRQDWVQFNHLMIEHGRKICTARKAFCEICPVSDLCPQVGVSLLAGRKGA